MKQNKKEQISLNLSNRSQQKNNKNILRKNNKHASHKFNLKQKFLRQFQFLNAFSRRQCASARQRRQFKKSNMQGEGEYFRISKKQKIENFNEFLLELEIPHSKKMNSLNKIMSKTSRNIIYHDESVEKDRQQSQIQEDILEKVNQRLKRKIGNKIKILPNSTTQIVKPVQFWGGLVKQQRKLLCQLINPQKMQSTSQIRSHLSATIDAASQERNSPSRPQTTITYRTSNPRRGIKYRKTNPFLD